MGIVKDFTGPTAWTDFKARLALKSSKIQEFSFIGGEYTLTFTENTDLYRVGISSPADILDYTTNFQATANEKTELDVNVQNTVNVSSDDPGDDFYNYLDHGTILAGLNNTHTYTVPVGDTLKIRKLILSGSGHWKAEISIDSNVVATYIGTRANPTLSVEIPISVLTGENLNIKMFNRDPEDQCFYTSIIGGVIY